MRAMEHIANAYLRREATDADILKALGRYAHTKSLPFQTTEDGTFEAHGPGWLVRVTAVRRLRDVIAEVKRARDLRPDLRQSSMVCTVHARTDSSYPDAQRLEARAPFGETVASRSWEATTTCEALNIELAAFKPTVWDTRIGFYPEVRAR
jgi:hypothetical protein